MLQNMKCVLGLFMLCLLACTEMFTLFFYPYQLRLLGWYWKTVSDSNSFLIPL